MLDNAIRHALQWCERNHVAVPVDLLVSVRQKGIFYQAMPLGYSEIRREYWRRSYNTIHSYLTTNKTLEEARAEYLASMIAAFTAAANVGAAYSGGKLDEEDEAWLDQRKEEEKNYILALFLFLAALKLAGDFDAAYEALRRADGYSEGLDLVYNRFRIAAAGNKLLRFVGDDGEESCSDCQRLKGVRKPARWWIQTDNVPPNRNFECKGYRCEHYLEDEDGRRMTL